METGAVIASDAHLAITAAARLFGLIGRRSLAPSYALGIEQCDWIHTFGVCLPIDVAYCDAQGRVLRLVENLKSGRIAPRSPGATIAWEMLAGGFSGHVWEGQRLVFQPAGKSGPKTRP